MRHDAVEIILYMGTETGHWGTCLKKHLKDGRIFQQSVFGSSQAPQASEIGLLVTPAQTPPLPHV